MSASKKLIDNALNPAWRDAAVHLFTTQEWDASLPDAVANETIHEMTYGKGYALRQLAPDSGAYINQVCQSSSSKHISPIRLQLTKNQRQTLMSPIGNGHSGDTTIHVSI